MAVAGWYPDPMGRAWHRYFDGVQWTDHVATNGRAMPATRMERLVFDFGARCGRALGGLGRQGECCQQHAGQRSERRAARPMQVG